MILAVFNDERYCPHCKTKDSIELYDIFNNSLNYKIILSLPNIKQIINSKQLNYFKCKSCGKIYNIQWLNNKPYPIRHTKDVDYFLKNFSK